MSPGTNHYISSWSGEGSIAIDPHNPAYWVVGGFDWGALAGGNAAGYNESGYGGAYTSHDGGTSWLSKLLSANTTWSDVNSPQCGQRHAGEASVVYGQNQTVYYFDSPFDVLDAGCKQVDGGSVYVSISHDGGETWGRPIGVAGYGPGEDVDGPSAAVNLTTGIVFVAYSDLINGDICVKNSTDEGLSWGTPSCFDPQSSPNRSLTPRLRLDPFGALDVVWTRWQNDTIYFARSTDQGATFNAPIFLGSFGAYYPSTSPDAIIAPTLPAMAVDTMSPSPFDGRIYVAWQNGSGGTDGSPGLSFTVSANNGSSWSVPENLTPGSALMDYQPTVAVGEDGTVYVDWIGVNHTTGHYRLFATESRDGGATFDPPFTVSDEDSNPNLTAQNPWLGDYSSAVPNARGVTAVWTDERSPLMADCPPLDCSHVWNTSLYYAQLTDSALYSNVPAQIGVNDTNSGRRTISVNESGSPLDWLGGESYQVSAPRNVTWNGTNWSFSLWYGPFISQSPNVSDIVGQSLLLHACYVSAPEPVCTAPGAPGRLDLHVSPSTAAVTIDGVPVALTGGGASLLEPPGSHTVNSSQPWYANSTAVVTVTTAGTTDLNVTLQKLPGRIEGTVSPTNASVTLNATSVTVLPNGSFVLSASPGTYALSATAPAYHGYENRSVVVTSSNVTSISIVLSPYPAWINGTVFPRSATVLVDGVLAPLAVGGTFGVSVGVGVHWVNTSAPGYFGNSSGPLRLGPGGSVGLRVYLERVNGTLKLSLDPVTAGLTLNLLLIPTPGGSTELNLSPGLYYLRATASTFTPWAGNVTIDSNLTSTVRIALNVSPGWIAGSVSPSAASLTVDGQVAPLDRSGSFNVTLQAGEHWVNATAPGHGGWAELTNVSPGRTTNVSLSLSQATGNSPLFELLLAGGVVAAGLVAIAVGLLVRRNRRRGSTSPGPEEAAD